MPRPHWLTGGQELCNPCSNMESFSHAVLCQWAEQPSSHQRTYHLHFSFRPIHMHVAANHSAQQDHERHETSLAAVKQVCSSILKLTCQQHAPACKTLICNLSADPHLLQPINGPSGAMLPPENALAASGHLRNRLKLMLNSRTTLGKECWQGRPSHTN